MSWLQFSGGPAPVGSSGVVVSGDANGDGAVTMLPTPGHTPGHVVLAEESEQAVFTGDCLFYGTVGRSDLPGGDHEQLIASIRENILDLGDDFAIYCGHGPDTTIGHERATNPFLTGAYQIPKGRFI